MRVCMDPLSLLITITLNPKPIIVFTLWVNTMMLNRDQAWPSWMSHNSVRKRTSRPGLLRGPKGAQGIAKA